MNQITDPNQQSQNSATAGTQAAEQRARRAEQKIEELEKKVAELKSGQNNSRPASPAPKPSSQPGNSLEQLRVEPMMAHLMDALEAGQDIGHYGRLTFAMIAHHFLPPEQVLEWLNKDPDLGQDQAVALLRQVESRDYNPPRRDRILAWQAQQDFPIIPNPDDPDSGNVYRNLKFPDKVYEHIQEYQEEKAEADAG